jgi:K+/H+ antiporter YhaU regulatory subunit KhtT
VVWWVPILREDDVLKPFYQVINDGDNFVSIGDGKRTARTKVVLDIDDEENV